MKTLKNIWPYRGPNSTPITTVPVVPLIDEESRQGLWVDIQI